jgi:hypothetical protein
VGWLYPLVAERACARSMLFRHWSRQPSNAGCFGKCRSGGSTLLAGALEVGREWEKGPGGRVIPEPCVVRSERPEGSPDRRQNFLGGLGVPNSSNWPSVLWQRRNAVLLSVHLCSLAMRAQAPPNSRKSRSAPSILNGSHPRLVRQSPPFPGPSSGQDVSCHFERRRDRLSHDPRTKWTADQIREGS